MRINKLFYLTLLTVFPATAQLPVEVYTCSDFKSAYEGGTDISLQNDLHCEGLTIEVPSRLPEHLEGNGHSVNHVHFNTYQGGILNPSGVSQNISFSQIHLTKTYTSDLYFYIVARGVEWDGYIHNVKFSQISSDEPFVHVLGAINGEIDGLKVNLRGNTLHPNLAMFARGEIENATVSNVRIIGGNIQFSTNNGMALLSSKVKDSTLTNIMFRGLKVTTDDELWFVGNSVTGNYINGYTLKNVRFTNPQSKKFLITRNESTSGLPNRIENYRHNLWGSIDEPLFPLFEKPDPDSLSTYNVQAEGELFNIPAKCTTYLKQDYYYIPYKGE